MPTISPIWMAVLIASPSLWLIRGVKYCIWGVKTRTYVQRGWSAFFAVWAAVATLVLIYGPQWIVDNGRFIPIAVAGVAISRIAEIIHGFYKDAFDKIDAADPTSANKEGESGTSMRVVERLRWLGISYAENILSFAVLFFLDQRFVEDCPFCTLISKTPLSMADFLHFSVMTVTTTGYGDIAPVTPVARALSGAEALSGVLLLVLVLAAYLSTISGWSKPETKGPPPPSPPKPD